jgi:hypothetical protein
VAVLLAAAATAQQSGSLTGKVVDSVTKAPIPRARITAFRLNPQQPSTQLETRTSEEGVYNFPALAAGRYSINADRPGYTPSNASGTTNEIYEVKAGENTTGKDIVLAPQAIIRGRVLDADGEPVEQAHVQVLGMRRGRQAYGGPGVQTDDRGEFRIAKLPAGSYRILVSGGRMGAATLDPVSGQRQVYSPTYYPNATEAAQAAEVRVGAGDERAGVDIRLQRSFVVRVSGTVSGEIGKDEYVQVNVQPVDPRGDAGAGARHSSTAVSPQAGGRFVLDAVRSGEYILTATTQHAVATMRLRVGQTDLDDIGLTLRPFLKVEGQLRRDPDTKSSGGQVGFIAVGGNFAAGGVGQVRPDGTFTLERMTPGRHYINVSVPGGWVVRSITQGGQPVPSMIVDLTAGPVPIEVTIHNKPARIEGTVEATENSGTRLMAVAIEIDDEPLSPVILGVRTKSSPVRDNKFQITNLRAAKYKVFVVPQDLMELTLDPDNAAKLVAKATEVTLGEGVTVPVSLRPINEKDVEQN